MKEFECKTVSLKKGIILTSIFIILAIMFFVLSICFNQPFLTFICALSIFATVIVLLGFFSNQPNEAKVFTFFGSYKGTCRKQGLNWCNPLYLKKKMSLRKRNFNVDKIKVNDALGNPIEISAVVVWAVEDTYQATFDVENYETYVETQSESALRELAGMYPYDLFDDTSENVITLRDNNEEVNKNLQASVQKRLDKVGVEVIEARINHIAYAPEIAAAMLQRQQASAIIAARKIIVEGAVSMVEMALNDLKKKNIVALNDKNKAELVGNLLVVLCGDKSAQPVITTNKETK